MLDWVPSGNWSWRYEIGVDGRFWNIKGLPVFIWDAYGPFCCWLISINVRRTAPLINCPWVLTWSELTGAAEPYVWPILICQILPWTTTLDELLLNDNDCGWLHEAIDDGFIWVPPSLQYRFWFQLFKRNFYHYLDLRCMFED